MQHKQYNFFGSQFKKLALLYETGVFLQLVRHNLNALSSTFLSYVIINLISLYS